MPEAMRNRPKNASLPDISLNSGWIAQSSSRESEQVVASLARWSPEASRAVLVKRFNLPMRDVCVTYRLWFEDAPANATLRVNQREYTNFETPLEIDVTDEVMLEDNEIAFYVPDQARGSFGDIRLIVRPCDDHA